MDIYEFKVKIFRLSQAVYFISFAVMFIIFFLNFVTFGAFFGVMFPVFGVTIALVLLNFAIYFLFFRGKDERRLMLESWEWMKQWNLLGIVKKMEVDDSFEMTPGEKVIFPLTPCFYRASAALSFTNAVRDIIVTNKRILIGFHTSLFIYQKETFGEMNIWRSDTKEIPALSSAFGSLRDLLGGNSKITKIAYGEKNEGGTPIGSLRLSISAGALAADMEIYHPQAKEIYALFSAPK